MTGVTTASSFLPTLIQMAVSCVAAIQMDLSTSFATLFLASVIARTVSRASSVTPALLAPMARAWMGSACPATAALLASSRARCVTLYQVSVCAGYTWRAVGATPAVMAGTDQALMTLRAASRVTVIPGAPLTEQRCAIRKPGSVGARMAWKGFAVTAALHACIT